MSRLVRAVVALGAPGVMFSAATTPVAAPPANATFQKKWDALPLPPKTPFDAGPK